MPNDTNLYIRRTNPVNDAFSALFAGAGQIVDKIQMNNKQEDLLNDFRKTSGELKQASQINFQAQNDILNLVPLPEGSRQPIQPVTIPKTDVYDTMINSALQMNANYGQDASPYINALEGMYKNYFPDPQKPDIREGQNGEFIDFSDPNNPKVLRTPPPKVEKKTSYTVGEYGAMTVDELANLNDTQLIAGLEYLSPEVRTALFEKYPDIASKYDMSLKRGEFAPKTGTGSRRRYSGTRTKSEADTLSTVAENNLNYNDMTDEEKTKFDKSKQELADKYGMTPDELNQYAENYRITGDKEISDDEVTTANIQAYQQDLSAFQNDIETKVYAYPDAQGNMQPNYSISADDWFRELNEAGFFDNISASHYQIISDWFKQKTGVALRKYVKGE